MRCASHDKRLQPATAQTMYQLGIYKMQCNIQGIVAKIVITGPKPATAQTMYQLGIQVYKMQCNIHGIIAKIVITGPKPASQLVKPGDPSLLGYLGKLEIMLHSLRS
jgi:hypothetical protein